MGRLLLIALLTAATMEASAQEALTVRVVSPRAGFLFTDSEPVDVRVAVSNATGPVRVQYTVSESEGPWEQTGQV